MFDNKDILSKEDFLKKIKETHEYKKNENATKEELKKNAKKFKQDLKELDSFFEDFYKSLEKDELERKEIINSLIDIYTEKMSKEQKKSL